MDDRPTKKLKASDSPAHTKYVSANQGSGSIFGRQKAKGNLVCLFLKIITAIGGKSNIVILCLIS